MRPWPSRTATVPEKPTQHRRQKAREEGQVAKSQDLDSAVLLLVAVLALMLSGGALVEFLARYAQRQFGGQPWLSADTNFAVTQWNTAIWGLARYVLPIFGLMLVAAIAVNVGQVGFLFLPDKVSFDLTRLDPLKGLQRIFSLSSLVKLTFGIFKVVVIAAVALVSLYKDRDTLLGMTGLDMPQVAAYLMQVLLWTSLKIAVALLILAILDYAFQWWKQERDLRMTSQEVREEMKNLEGDPQIAARRRLVQRQLMLNRLSTAVPKADVVVTNPTEIAVAIKYDERTMAAPRVVAKGEGYMAAQIRKLAIEHGVPIVEKKPLARALYKMVEIGQEIPPQFYQAVAEILAYVYELTGKTKRRPMATAV